MMKAKDFRAGMAFLAVLVLQGCGGGGAPSTPPGSSGPVASTLAFPLQAAYVNSVQKGTTVYYAVSGTCAGTAETNDGAPTAATFEGKAASAVSASSKLTVTNCLPLITGSTETIYYDATFMQAGSSSSTSYGVFLTPPNIPSSVKVYDTNTIGTETIYADSTKTVKTGTHASSYTIEPDTASSAIVNFTTKYYDASGVLTSTVQDRYRILTDASLTAVSSDILYADGTHLILTTSAPPANAGPGTWGLPTLVSNDIYPQAAAGVQITGDGLGNMSLALPFINVSAAQTFVAGYQKPAGMNWGAQFAHSPVKSTTQAYLNGYQEVQLRSDSAGNAVAAWVDYNMTAPSDRNWTSNVYVKNYSTTTGWGAPLLMQFSTTAYATAVNLTVQPDGTAWLMWKERTYMDPTYAVYDKYALFAAKYSPLTGWGVAEKVTGDYSDAGNTGNLLGRIVPDNAGNPIAYYTTSASLSVYLTSKVAGVWSAPIVVAPIPGTVSIFTATNVLNRDFDVVEDSLGNAIAVWSAWDATGTIPAVYTNRYTAGVGWSGPAIAASSVSAYTGNPRITMDGAGNALLLWQGADPSQNVYPPAVAIWAARFDHVAGWQTPAVISQSGGAPQVAVDGLGNAVAIWSKFDPTLGYYIVMGCRYTNNVGWNTEQVISSGTGAIVSGAMRIAVYANGRATAVWPQDDVGNQSYKLWTNDFAP